MPGLFVCVNISMTKLTDEEMWCDLFPPEPWHIRVKYWITGVISQAKDWLIDSAHRPFYRYTVQRDGTVLENYCLHPYCHACTALADTLYQTDHYVTRDLSQLWVKRQSDVNAILSIREPSDREFFLEKARQIVAEIPQGESALEWIESRLEEVRDRCDEACQ